jgi:hypothetical protein
MTHPIAALIEMPRVLVISSVHRDLGLATAAQLYWLLGRLRPDVLFLEHSAAYHTAFLDGSRPTLESQAVRRYRDAQQGVELVPVEMHLEAAELKQKFDDLLESIHDASPRLCELELANHQHTATDGFAYLNGPLSAVLQSEMQREMRSTAEAVSDPSLTELYALWAATHDLRERTMISEVESFARQASFTKGVLLVGAAHRHALFEKLQQSRSDAPSPVTWEFDWHDEV